MTADIEDKKARASAWFRQLRDDICADFETLETEVTGPLADREPGRFEREVWTRSDAEGDDGGSGSRLGCLPRPR